MQVSVSFVQFPQLVQPQLGVQGIIIVVFISTVMVGVEFELPADHKQLH